MREDLIKILANIGDDYAGVIENLEEYIRKKQDEAVENYADKKSTELPFTTPEEFISWTSKKQTNNK